MLQMNKITAYYNENNKNTADWLRQLIKNGDITQGEVDDRSITEVEKSDIKGFERVHWFAGIGTWDYALNESGWRGNVWTASLPCQPFSVAGKRLGKNDERHLLPYFIELVRQCQPDAIFGEQVANAIKLGWLDDLQTNMEAENYTVGGCVLGAHSVNAPHIRQRLYWVANANITRKTEPKYTEHNKKRQSIGIVRNRETFGNPCGMVNAIGNNDSGKSAGSNGETGSSETKNGSRFAESGKFGRASEYVYVEWIECADNKQRPIKPGVLPLVDGITEKLVRCGDSIKPDETLEARVMRIKGYGNAIVAPLAIEFISAFKSARNE